MQSMAGHTLLRRNRLYRGMAIFFLIFALVDLTIIDLAFPQLCESDISPMPTSLSAINSTYLSGTVFAAASTGDDDDRDQRSEPECEEEDCFCCCSHIVPGVPLSIAPLGLKTMAAVAAITSLPSPPPQSTYHPPRSSKI
jgi:hypothetical protein